MAFSVSPHDKRDISRTLGKRHRDFSWTEDFFIGLIDRNESKMDVYWSVIALRNCGTERSIASLKSLSTHQSQDVKATAILTIARIARATETDYYAARLIDPSYRAKPFALWAISAYGDERAIPAVRNFIMKNKKKLAEKVVPAQEAYGITTYFYRTLGPCKTVELLTGEYGFIREALAWSLNHLPPMNARRFKDRYPEIDISLGTTGDA